MTNRSKAVASLSTVLMLAGCTRASTSQGTVDDNGSANATSHSGEPTAGGDKAAAATSQSPTTPMGGGGERDARPRALITSPYRGTSALDSAARVNVSISCPFGGTCVSDVTATVNTIASKMHFLSKDGSSVALVPDISKQTAQPVSPKGDTPVTVTPNDYLASFLPASGLVQDSSYQLEIRSDKDVVMGFLDSSATEQTAAIDSTTSPVAQTIPLFTGSRPAVTRIEMSNDPKKPPQSVRIRFSEPIEMATLVNGLKFVGKSQSLSGCTWSAANRGCALAGTTEISELVDFMFDSTRAVTDIQTGSIFLDGSVSGGGRDIAAAAQLQSATLEKTSLGTGLLKPLEHAGWESCSSAGDILCVRYLGP